MPGTHSDTRISKSVSRTKNRTGRRTPTIPSRSSEAGISASTHHIYVPQKLAVCLLNAGEMIRAEQVFDPNFNYVLSTAGIASCVGLILHDGITKSTVLAHLDSDSDTSSQNITQNFLKILNQNVAGTREDIRVTIHNNGLNDAKFHALLLKDQGGALSDDAIKRHTEYLLIKGIHQACLDVGITPRIIESPKDVNINLLTGTVSEYNERAPTDAEIVSRMTVDENTVINEIAMHRGDLTPTRATQAASEGAKAGGMAAVLAAGDAGVSRRYAARQGVLVGARAAAQVMTTSGTSEEDGANVSDAARRAVAELNFDSAPVASPGISQEGSIAKAMETWPNHENCFVLTLTEPMQLFHHNQLRSAQIYETPDHHEPLHPVADERVQHALSRLASGRSASLDENIEIAEVISPLDAERTTTSSRKSCLLGDGSIPEPSSRSSSLSTQSFARVRRSLFQELNQSVSETSETSEQSEVSKQSDELDQSECVNGKIRRTLLDELNEAESSESQDKSSSEIGGFETSTKDEEALVDRDSEPKVSIVLNDESMQSKKK